MTRPGWRRRIPRSVRRAGRTVLRRASALRHRLLPERRPPCVIGIPMMNLHERTAAVIADIDVHEFDELVIYDHASDDPATIAWLRDVERREKVVVDRRPIIPEDSLYRSWNDTIRRALARFDAPEVDVVILNNDVRVPRGFIRCLTRALRSGDPRVLIAYPDTTAKRRDGLPRTVQLTPTRGLHMEGGMTGWAFALRAEAFREELPLIDERLKFYSGDRDLIHTVESHGYTAARVDGLACEHGMGVTRRRRPDLVEQQKRDVALWWGEHRKASKRSVGGPPMAPG